MPAELLERLTGRVTFVVGKGGVGKTTVAGAIAVALVDSGTPTHLLSTDPAHSLGDLFGRNLGADPQPSPCGEQLTLEELDAAELVERRLQALVPGLKEVIDRGTYLDVNDADSLLEASLPGLDEIGGALRIAELSAPRLVVDTAPTGHLLRLLDTPAVVASWLDVFEAMAGKADAVASALVGQEVRLSVEADLATLGDQMSSFEEVSGAADFVVVTAAGAVVAAETRRLAEALGSRGLRVAATVAIDRAGADAEILVPYRPALAGCAALRSLWTGGSQSSPSTEVEATEVEATEVEVTAPSRRGDAGLPPELDRELIVFAGKGGVGKSTCAAATAVRLAERDRVLLMSADPAGSLHDILAGDTFADLEVRELEGEAALERLRSLYRAEVERAFAAIGLAGTARLDRAVIESLWQLAPPGLDELMSVSRLAEEVESGSRVVLDSAPTGHFLRLVAMPELALDWVRRIMRILLKYSAMGDLDAPAEQLLRFARQFRTLRERLVDGDRTALVVVTLDEPMAWAETDRLVARLRTLGLPLSGVLVNRTTGPVAARPGGTTWRAPEVEEPKGVAALQQFTRVWERVG